MILLVQNHHKSIDNSAEWLYYIAMESVINISQPEGLDPIDQYIIEALQKD